MADKPASPFVGLERAMVRETGRESPPQTTPTEEKPDRQRNDQQATSRAEADSEKVTYRLSLEALDAVEDAKRLLRSRYRIKATRGQIAEAALIAAYADLVTKGEGSSLVKRLTTNTENQKAGKPERNKSS
jgi:hypothetical protein